MSLKQLQGEELTNQAIKLGVSFDQLGNPRNNAELQRRVSDALRSNREHRLWIIALVSSIASVVSAVAAWFAVFCK